MKITQQQLDNTAAITYMYLHYFWISKYIVQNVQLVSEEQRVYDIVLGARWYLHEAGEAEEGAVGMVLQVDSNLAACFQIRAHQP